MTRMRGNALATIAVLAVSVTACGQGVDRLGDEPSAAVVTLSAEFGYPHDEISEYLDEVERISNGQLILELPEPPERTTFEDHALIERVREGAIDLAIVPTRDWSAYDVHAYDALLAPFLIDSLDLQRQVLASHVLDDGLVALDELGLVHGGLIEGGLRVPAAHAQALLAPEDFAGRRIATSGSAIADDTLRALGATPSPMIAGKPLGEVDAMEGQMTAIINNGYESTLPHITGNVVFWPRSNAVVVNKERFDALTPEQQGWLLTAADTSRDAQVAKMQEFENEVVDRACRGGITFAHATDAQLAALRAAVEPVYADLRADPTTSRAIDAIEAMKTDRPRELTCQPGDVAGAPASPNGVATQIDGTWHACPTAADIIAAGGDRQESVDNDGCHTMVLDRGLLRHGGAAGTYEVKGNQLVIHQGTELFEFTWSLYQDKLSLGPPANPKALSPAPSRAVAYERQDD